MEQRPLRLGDILDDYCPRERRVTNHAVVAMIEEDVKQTRCTTCDAEHPYKGARVPKRRKKETPAALYSEVLAGMPEPEGAEVHLLPTSAVSIPVPLAASADAVPAIDPVPSRDAIDRHEPGEDPQPSMHSDDDRGHGDAERQPEAADADYAPVDGADDVPAADGPVHRPLIRATLPRPEGQKDARPAPEFTVRHSPGRGNSHANHSAHGNGQNRGHFRGGERTRMRAGSGAADGNAHSAPNGNRAPSGGQRFHRGSNRPSGSGRQAAGRGGAPSAFRNANSSGANGKRGRGSRG